MSGGAPGSQWQGSAAARGGILDEIADANLHRRRSAFPEIETFEAIFSTLRFYLPASASVRPALPALAHDPHLAASGEKRG